MSSSLEQQLKKIQDSEIHLHLKEVLHGIEKEGLRVDAKGAISMFPHPQKLGSPLTNSDITTDFSESLLELITPVFTETSAALDYLQTVHQFTYSALEDELIWAGSMPCYIEDQALIPIAQYGDSNIGKMKHIYRVGLSHRYGKLMQSIAGIHYNFSFPEKFWLPYQVLEENTDNIESFRSSSYFRMIRNFRRNSWLLLYLFGSSPALSSSFLENRQHGLQTLHKETLYLPHATSLRMSGLGYTTTAQSSLNICFNQLKTYIESLRIAINTSYPPYEAIGVKVDGNYRQLATTILQIENEYYSDIRPKRVPSSGETPLQALQNQGVEYIEVRNTDVNPLLPLGIDLQQALFFDIFLISCLFMTDEQITPAECKTITENLARITSRGREPELLLVSDEREIPLLKKAEELINQCRLTAEILDTLHGTNIYKNTVSTQLDKVKDSSLTPSAKILDALISSDMEYTQWILEMSRQHRETLVNSPEDTEIIEEIRLKASLSIEKQKDLENGDTMGFDDFLNLYRIGKTAT